MTPTNSPDSKTRPLLAVFIDQSLTFSSWNFHVTEHAPKYAKDAVDCIHSERLFAPFEF
jgi:hypothetical protein